MIIQLPKFETAKILVVGDIMLDRYWHGNTKRISPEAPVPVVNVNELEERPGGAANVAFNLATLGCQVALVGLVGNDEAANSLNTKLTQSGINCHLLRVNNVPTITKLRVISRHQQLLRLDFEENFSFAVCEDLTDVYKKLLDAYDVVVLSDYAKGTLANAQDLIQLARARNKIVIVDPKGSDFCRYKQASLITPNTAEFIGVMGEFQTEQEFESKAKEMLTDLELDALLVTRGEQGMSLLSDDLEIQHIPTRAQEVYDVTGAGDTVISVFAASQACGMSYRESAELSNIAAGIVVGKLGTATVSVPELRMAVRTNQEHLLGIVSEEDLLLAVENAKAQGERIVMTNGCFDLLHAGHVSYLESARQLGDRLIVAVNSDESVQILKGSQRPIVPLAQRMAVLAGLASVDWVVSFSEETPQRLICNVLPDILVKGGDYKAEEVAGFECVTENGGRVEILQFLDGCSTSEIIRKILASQ